MQKRHPTQLNKAEIIAGFFREALFFSRGISLETQTYRSQAAIIEIDEPNGRIKSNDRFLILALDIDTELDLNNIPSTLFTCNFPHFVGTWEGSIESLGDGKYRTRIPSVLNISNKRTTQRVKPIFQSLKAIVLVQTGSIHAEGLLEIENFSTDGFGGTLRVPAEIPIRFDTTITGFAQATGGAIRINCHIAQVSIISEPTSFQNELLCRVGLRTIRTADDHSTNTITNSTGIERRQFNRSESEFEIEVQSPLNPKHIIPLRLNDVSIAGFSAILIESGDTLLLPIGCCIQFKQSSILAELIDINDHCYRFQLIDGTQEDRLLWLKRLTKYQNEKTAINTATGADLINLFCESGALASAFLKAQQNNSHEFLTGLATEESNETWVHRWIEKTGDGDDRGHISAMRIANNIWFIGDLAGAIDPEKKVSSKFVPSFFRSFKEFSLSAKPCPRILVTWNSEHPYWRGFETYLQTEGRKFVEALAHTVYFRSSNQATKSNLSKISVEPISAHDFSAIKLIINTANSICNTQLLAALDFSVDTFGSPELHRIIKREGKHFQREYVLVEYENLKWIAILSKFPKGVSLNRSLDVTWLFPLTTQEVSKQTQEKVHASLKSYALSKGINIPGFLEVQIPTNFVDSGTKAMKWFLIHPSALAWMEKKS